MCCKSPFFVGLQFISPHTRLIRGSAIQAEVRRHFRFKYILWWPKKMKKSLKNGIQILLLPLPIPLNSHSIQIQFFRNVIATFTSWQVEEEEVGDWVGGWMDLCAFGIADFMTCQADHLLPVISVHSRNSIQELVYHSTPTFMHSFLLLSSSGYSSSGQLILITSKRNMFPEHDSDPIPNLRISHLLRQRKLPVVVATNYYYFMRGRMKRWKRWGGYKKQQIIPKLSFIKHTRRRVARMKIITTIPQTKLLEKEKEEELGKFQVLCWSCGLKICHSVGEINQAQTVLYKSLHGENVNTSILLFLCHFLRL